MRFVSCGNFVKKQKKLKKILASINPTKILLQVVFLLRTCSCSQAKLVLAIWLTLLVTRSIISLSWDPVRVVKRLHNGALVF